MVGAGGGPFAAATMFLNRLTIPLIASDSPGEPERSMPIVINTAAIEGYADVISVEPGGTLALKVSSYSPTFSLEIARYGAETEVLIRESGIPGGIQNYPLDAFREGAGWETRYSLEIPAGWRSGIYAAKLTDDGTGHAHYVSFVVKKDPAAPPARLVVLANTNTWQAYNDWAGGSFYVDFPSADIPEDEVLARQFAPGFANMHRPNQMAYPLGDEGHLTQAELHVLRWLERNGWEFDLISDWDLHHEAGILDGYAAFMLQTHPEYWSEAMYDQLDAYLDRGGNLAYIGGNAIDLKVVVSGTVLEVRTAGGPHQLDGEPGGYWRNLGRPQAGVLGVAYDSYGYHTYAPFEVLLADHWVFAGTGLAAGSLIGQTGLNRGKASGWETDKRGPGTPENVTLLAKGTNPDNGGAEMTYFEHPGGGGVFSAGSITFGGSLAVDGNLSQILQNVLSRFTGQPGLGSAPR